MLPALVFPPVDGTNEGEWAGYVEDRINDHVSAHLGSLESRSLVDDMVQWVAKAVTTRDEEGRLRLQQPDFVFRAVRTLRNAWIAVLRSERGCVGPWTCTDDRYDAEVGVVDRCVADVLNEFREMDRLLFVTPTTAVVK